MRKGCYVEWRCIVKRTWGLLGAKGVERTAKVVRTRIVEAIMIEMMIEWYVDATQGKESSINDPGS